ncbi:hypothetical protein COBT_003706, partial [Conglomerata obtusa]
KKVKKTHNEKSKQPKTNQKLVKQVIKNKPRMEDEAETSAVDKNNKVRALGHVIITSMNSNSISNRTDNDLGSNSELDIDVEAIKQLNSNELSIDDISGDDVKKEKKSKCKTITKGEEQQKANIKKIFSGDNNIANIDDNIEIHFKKNNVKIIEKNNEKNFHLHKSDIYNNDQYLSDVNNSIQMHKKRSKINIGEVDNKKIK